MARESGEQPVLVLLSILSLPSQPSFTDALSKIRKSDLLNLLKELELSVQFWLGIDSYPRSITTFGWGSRLAAHVDFFLMIFDFSDF